MEDCIVYLVWQLRQTGFEIRFTWPNLLYISWRHHEGDYLMKHNPIIKAMTPEPIAPPRPSLMLAAQAPKKKEKPVLSFQREVEMITANSGYNGQTVNRSMIEMNGPRRAIDYEPPASFLQNMDRPVRSAQAKGGVLSDLWSS
jgi:hypothetical protein